MKRIAQPLRWLKLSDFNSTFGIPHNSHSPWLIKSRSKQRYSNPTQKQLELACVLQTVFTSNNDFAIDLVSQRAWRFADLNFRSHTINEILATHKVSPAQLGVWVDCFRAKSLDKALDIMKDEEWPTFLLLHTFNRPVSTRAAAHRLVQLYQQQLPLIEAQYQLELCWLMLHVAQRHLIEYLESIVRLFMKLADESVLNSIAFNELLWKLARYGTFWSTSDLKVIKAAQKRLFEMFTKEQLDAKGCTALAYVAHFESPSLALQIVEGSGLSSGSASGSSATSTDLPYKYGKHLIQLHCTTSFEHGLTVLNSIDKPDRKPAIWVAFLQGVIRGGHLDNNDELPLKLWKYWKYNQIRPSSQMACLILRKIKSFDKRREILDEFLEFPNIRLNTMLVQSMLAPLHSMEDFVECRDFMDGLDPHLLTSNTRQTFLYIQSHWDPTNVWDSYLKILSAGDPQSDTIGYLCQAASKCNKWGDVWAVQRALIEVKRWIQFDPLDTIKTYPTEQMIHSFIVMLGKANYQDELDQVLTWLKSIGFTPTKRILCALIVHSQYGETMQKLAPKSNEWPSEREVELYKLEGIA